MLARSLTPSPDISRQLLDHLENLGTQDVELTCDGLPVVFCQSDKGIVLHAGTGVDSEGDRIDRVLGQFSHVVIPLKIIPCINPDDNCWWLLRYLEPQRRSELISVLGRILDVRDEFKRWLSNNE